MKLRTKRLHLTPMSVNDLDVFHQSNTDPSIRKYLWDDEIISHSLSKEILEEVENKFQEDKWGLWKIVDAIDDVFMGYVGLWIFFDEAQPQLIYALLPQFTNSGYAVEAAAEIAKYALEVLHFKNLIAATDPPNKQSIAVCVKLGMVLKEEKEMDGKPTLFFELRNPSAIQI